MEEFESSSNHSQHEKPSADGEADLIKSQTLSIPEDAHKSTTNPLNIITKSTSDDDLPETQTRSTVTKLGNIYAKCLHCCAPVLTENNPPLSDDAGFCEQLRYAFMCPPHGLVSVFISMIAAFAIIWGVLISVSGDNALPGGGPFSLLVLFIAAIIGGYLVALMKLPPLLGMLIIGVLLRNVPKIDIGKDISEKWSGPLRNTALTVILIRAGLGLDPQALKKLSWVVFRLAFLPCLCEALVTGISSHLMLGLPWIWGFMLGFVVAAVSPAVVVPCMLNLSERGYGIDKGIPTLVIAAASIDDVLAITGFGVVLGMAFSKGNIVWVVFKGPLEALLGTLIGVVFGMVLWFIPSQKNQDNFLFFRGFLLVGFGMVAVIGGPKIELPGAGPLCCLTMAFVAAYGWRREKSSTQLMKVQNGIGLLWIIVQPLLFGLIGSAVDATGLDLKTVGLGIASISVGLLARMMVSFLAVSGGDRNLKEKLFIPFAWLPKATVQAAIGPVAYQMATKEAEKTYGFTILTIAVLIILITAPLGSVLITLTGPRLLHKTNPLNKNANSYDNNPVLQTDDKPNIADPCNSYEENTRF